MQLRDRGAFAKDGTGETAPPTASLILSHIAAGRVTGKYLRREVFSRMPRASGSLRGKIKMPALSCRL
jgi:hypothetical protein